MKEVGSIAGVEPSITDLHVHIPPCSSSAVELLSGPCVGWTPAFSRSSSRTDSKCFHDIPAETIAYFLICITDVCIAVLVLEVIEERDLLPERRIYVLTLVPTRPAGKRAHDLTL